MAVVEQIKICPKCKELLPNRPEFWQTLDPVEPRNSLSRRDNETFICNQCGGAEAYADYFGVTDVEARMSLVRYIESQEGQKELQ